MVQPGGSAINKLSLVYASAALRKLYSTHFQKMYEKDNRIKLVDSGLDRIVFRKRFVLKILIGTTALDFAKDVL